MLVYCPIASTTSWPDTAGALMTICVLGVPPCDDTPRNARASGVASQARTPASPKQTGALAPLPAGVSGRVAQVGDRAPSPKASPLHTQMAHMMGTVSQIGPAVQRMLRSVTDALDDVARSLVGPQLAFAGAGAPVQTQAPATVDPIGPTVMAMSTIRDMISGSLARECPGQWLDVEYEDVKKAAKKDKSAKKAKKLADQGKRLRAKIRGK